MRKIVLSPHDLEMFAATVTASELEFIEKHWKPFRQMWTEQGRKFWIQFLTVYRISATEYGVIKDLLNMKDGFQSLIDELFILIHENFIDGSFSSAKKLIHDIITLVVNKDKFKFLQSKSFAKDPFYNKETRDSFRHLFGSPRHNESYIKVCALHEIYTVFGGAVVTCLKRWLVAEELPNGAEESWQPIVLTEQEKQESAFKHPPFCFYCHQKDDGTIPSTRYSGREAFMMEKLHGQPCGPWFVAGWKRHEDPRFHDTKNPLYNLMENPESDWRDSLDLHKFLEFHRYVNKNYPVLDAKEENTFEHTEFSEDGLDILKTFDKVRIRVVNKSAEDGVPLAAASTGGRHTEMEMQQRSKKASNMKTGGKVDMDLSNDVQIQEHQHVLTSESKTICTQSTNRIKSPKEVYEDKTEPEKSNLDNGLAECLSFGELSLDGDKEKLPESDESGDIFAIIRKLRQPADNFSDTEIKDQANNDDNPRSKWKSKKCSQCKQWELLPKTFKMCQLCKEMHLKSARYYCSKDCQMKDWKARHKLEHKHNLLK